MRSGKAGKPEKAGRFGGRDEEKPGRFGKDHGKSFGRGEGRAEGRGGRRDRSRGGSDRRPSRGPREYGDVTKLKATIDKNRKGFGFLQFENREYEDAFLNPYEAEKFFHGDRVEALISDRGEVVELRVIAHRFRELVGRFYPAGKTGIVVYERKRAREEVPVSGDRKGAKSREWVRAKMLYPEADETAAREGEFDREEATARANISCEILEVYGEDLPARADIQMVSAEYNLTEEHSPEAVAEAESFKLDLNDPNRVDLRHLPFITIDGETARDFDDAIFVERTKSGGFLLWVAIADVSHYVTEGTILNDEAFSRATSVYFPERAFHMLPRALSENLCSLRPNEPRLTMTSKIEFDRHGKKIGVEVMNTLIDSRRRATYNEIQAESEKHEKDPKWEYAAHFELYRILRKLRNDRGSIDFDLPEAEVRVDSATGEPISIKNRPRLDAHRLIEEFMIAANESVTEWALERKLPFLYRVHDEPPRQALVRFQELCAHYAVEFILPKEGKGNAKATEKRLADALNAVVKSIVDHPAQIMLNNALLRSMAQAHYSSVYGEHFGLASTAYTHFTSPIRRYPDLVVHRMLKLAIEAERTKRPMEEKERERLNDQLLEIAEHCSYRERIASDAEREAIKLKQVRIMLKEIGNEFDGKVMGMIEAGMFVGIPDPFVEGFLAQEAMGDDFYTYNEDRQVFVGKRSKKSYKIGDPVRIRVDRVDLDLRRVDFSLLDANAEKTEKPEPPRQVLPADRI
jgi:ribonuclease R